MLSSVSWAATGHADASDAFPLIDRIRARVRETSITEKASQPSANGIKPSVAALFRAAAGCNPETTPGAEKPAPDGARPLPTCIGRITPPVVAAADNAPEEFGP